MTNKDNINLFDKHTHPYMVRWFSVAVLAGAARRAFVSAIFGSYADRRLMQAALDVVKYDSDDFKKRYDFSTLPTSGKDNEVWVDYIADLGDGFDSTYAMAYLLSRPKLELEGNLQLPRGQMLIMGGDQVYPTAGREEYDRRLKTPYTYAFPNSTAPDSKHPLLFLIPGNHDWYDGLTMFLALFCRGRSTSLGSWETTQHRSYFALQLPHNWWILGIDSQLAEDIDAPQAEYFVNIAKSNAFKNAKVILCNSVPTWLKADQEDGDPAERAKFGRALNYIACDIIRNNCGSAKICAVLSGDLHHYSRYSALKTGTQFVTAGGGGAFMHPTHQLKDKIIMDWVRDRQTASLKTDPSSPRVESNKAACYPPKAVSQKLVLGNWCFAFHNWSFSLFLGYIYLLVCLCLGLSTDSSVEASMSTAAISPYQIISHVALTPSFWVVALSMMSVFWLYAGAKRRFAKLEAKKQNPTKTYMELAKTNLKWGLIFSALIHGALQVGLVTALFGVLPFLNYQILGPTPAEASIEHLFHTFVYAIEIVVIGGGLGATIWGLYLIATNLLFKVHCDDAFCALSYDGYKNFLRLRMTEDSLTIFPIGLDTAPKRSEWKVNPAYVKGNQNEAVVIPTSELHPHLIEDAPIVIKVSDVLSMDQKP